MLTWVILVQLDLTGTGWLLFPDKKKKVPLHQMVTGRIYRAFLVIFNHLKNFTLCVRIPPTPTSYFIHWWQNNQLEIRNHVHSCFLNTAMGPIWGSVSCSRTVSMSAPPTPKGVPNMSWHISIGLIRIVSFTNPVVQNIPFFLPTCETHMPYSACHALMNTSYFCGCTCRHLFKWKSQWNEMVIKKRRMHREGETRDSSDRRFCSSNLSRNLPHDQTSPLLDWDNIKSPEKTQTVGKLITLDFYFIFWWQTRVKFNQITLKLIFIQQMFVSKHYLYDLNYFNNLGKEKLFTVSVNAKFKRICS